MKHSTHKNHHCPNCPESFYVRTQLLHHIANHHSSTKYQCFDPECRWTFRSQTTHKIHYVRKHMKDKQLFVRRGKEFSECLSCHRILKHSAISYHVALCSRESPFSINSMYCMEVNQNIPNDECIDENKLPQENEDEFLFGNLQSLPDNYQFMDDERNQTQNDYSEIDLEKVDYLLAELVDLYD